MIGRWHRILYVQIALVLVFHTPSWAGQEKAAEYQIKAAFLYNFAKFVAWPDETFSLKDTPFTFEILGKDPFGHSIDSLLSQKVGGRPVDVVRVNGGGMAKPCQVLFISASEIRHTGRLIKRLQGSPVLTVSDIPGFVQKGGIIEFTVENMQVRFLINLEAARMAGLKINYQLLALAKKVVGR